MQTMGGAPFRRPAIRTGSVLPELALVGRDGRRCRRVGEDVAEHFHAGVDAGLQPGVQPRLEQRLLRGDDLRRERAQAGSSPVAARSSGRSATLLARPNGARSATEYIPPVRMISRALDRPT